MYFIARYDPQKFASPNEGISTMRRFLCILFLLGHAQSIFSQTTPIQGTLTIQGFSAESSYTAPILSLDRDAALNSPGYSLAYVDNGEQGKVVNFLDKDGGVWEWKQMGSENPRLQMDLSAANVLRLADPNGVGLGIVLDPMSASPKITIGGLEVATLPSGVSEFLPAGKGITLGANGNVGIGTNSPSSLLSIVGSAAGGPEIDIQAATAQAGDLMRFRDTAGNQLVSVFTSVGDKSGLQLTSSSRGYRRSSSIYIQPDEQNGFCDTIISGNGGRLYLGEPNGYFWGVNFRNVVTIEDVPPILLKYQGNDSLWTSWFANGYGGSILKATDGDLVLSPGGGAWITTMQSDSQANPSAFRFKSYSNDGSVTASSYPYLYRFDSSKGLEMLDETVTTHTRWDVAGIELMVLKTNGRVGIGTNNPETKLHVVGDARVQGSLNVGGATTFTGSVRIVDAQGDVMMGEFGNQ